MASKEAGNVNKTLSELDQLNYQLWGLKNISLVQVDSNNYSDKTDEYQGNAPSALPRAQYTPQSTPNYTSQVSSANSRQSAAGVAITNADKECYISISSCYIHGHAE